MTEIVGILNLTPDSFSGDGLAKIAPEGLLENAEAMLAAGAAVVDVGAESTRPGATTLTADEEWQRLEPFAKLVAKRSGAGLFSLDTYHPENATRALDNGFVWVNDVSGGSPAMFDTVKNYNAKLVLMHSLGVPADPARTFAPDADAIAEIITWGASAIDAAEAAGIDRQRIILDPGLGFGKTAAQSLAVIQHLNLFAVWDVPVLIGHSRKSFLKPFAGDDMHLRDAATLAVSSFLVVQGVDYIRVHDVAAHRTLRDIADALT